MRGRIYGVLIWALVLATTHFGAYILGQDWGMQLAVDAFEREAYYHGIALDLLDKSTAALGVVLRHDTHLRWDLDEVLPNWHADIMRARIVLEPSSP